MVFGACNLEFMRILMVIGQFYPVIGGAERQCLKLSQALKVRGHEVKVLTVWNPRDVRQNETVEGVPVERVWYPVLNVFGYRVGLGFLAPIFMFWRIFRVAHAYDVIHVHQCLWPAFSATLAACQRGRPIVCKIGNSGERFDLNVLRRTHIYGKVAAHFVKKYIARFVWTSKAVLDDLRAEGVAEDKLVYIPNGVELSPHPNPLLRGEGQGEGDARVQFIFTGTFTLKKNLLSLVEAVRIMSSQYREKMKLILLGDGSDRVVLTETVKQYNLNSAVEIRGPVDDVGSYLGQSDVFVLPSSTEGLSNSALEAMTYGLPVILSNRGGNSDLVALTLPSPIGRGVGVRGDTGILIDPDHVESLRDAIQYMIEHSAERQKMGERSRRIVEERYAMDKVVQQHEELYRSLKH